MKPDNVEYLPIWKSEATAEERFNELAMIARKHPERFKRVVVIFEEQLPLESGRTYPDTITRYVTTGCCATMALGVIEAGKQKLLRWMFDGED